MSSIEQGVLASFFDGIGEDDAVPDAVVDGLRAALSGEKLPKADLLTQIVTRGTGDPLA